MFGAVKAGILPDNLWVVSGNLIPKMCVFKKTLTVIAAVSHQVNSGQIVAILQWAAIAIESSLTLNEIKIYKELKFSAWV